MQLLLVPNLSIPRGRFPQIHQVRYRRTDACTMLAFEPLPRETVQAKVYQYRENSPRVHTAPLTLLANVSSNLQESLPDSSPKVLSVFLNVLGTLCHRHQEREDTCRWIEMLLYFCRDLSLLHDMNSNHQCCQRRVVHHADCFPSSVLMQQLICQTAVKVMSMHGLQHLSNQSMHHRRDSPECAHYMSGRERKTDTLEIHSK